MNALKAIILFALTAIPLQAAFPQVTRTYRAEQYRDSVDSLQELYGRNKVMPAEFRLQILLALSHYPELKDTRIEFSVGSAFIPLTSRPALWSVSRSKEKRVYKVVISDNSLEEIDPILLENQPFNAQVGVIGHELAHTAYYSRKGLLPVMSTAMRYLISGYRSGFEKGADLLTIDHGLGWQLLDYARFIRSRPGITDKSIRWMDQYYMSPDEIRSAMKILPDLYPDLQPCHGTNPVRVNYLELL